MDGLLKHVNKSQEMTLTLYIAFLHAVCLWKGGPGVGGGYEEEALLSPSPPHPDCLSIPNFHFCLGDHKNMCMIFVPEMS